MQYLQWNANGRQEICLGSSISIVPVRAFLQVPCEFLAMYVLLYQVYFSVSIELIQLQFAHDVVIKTLETKRLWWQCLILCAFCYCDKSCHVKLLGFRVCQG